MLNKYQPRSVPGIKAVNLFALQHIKEIGLLLSSAVCQEKTAENPVWLVIKAPQLTSSSGFETLIITFKPWSNNLKIKAELQGQTTVELIN